MQRWRLERVSRYDPAVDGDDYHNNDADGDWHDDENYHDWWDLWWNSYDDDYDYDDSDDECHIFSWFDY